MSGTMADHRSSGAALEPTFTGMISSTMDALILFEACLSGRLAHVPRRPHDRERTSLIKSGHVFIYEEHSSGIKRWTDGVSWSPSRILGNFLLYRELDKPFQPGEKKRAMKRKTEGGVSKPANAPRSNSIGYNSTLPTPGTQAPFDNNHNNGHNGNSAQENERAFIGSLVDSYQFKTDGLIKKTISIQYRGVQHHLVSYYSLDDAVHGRLTTPTTDVSLQNIAPRSALISSATFRAPVDDHEFVVGDQRMTHMYAIPHMSEFGVLNSITARSMSVPNIQYPADTWGATGSYLANANYTLAATLPPVNYQQPTYAYDQHAAAQYRLPSSSQSHQAFNPAAMMQARGHSILPERTESNHLGYSPLGVADRSRISSTSSLPNNYSLSSQRLAQSTVNGGGVFEQPGLANTPNHGSNAYGSDGTNNHDGNYDNGSAGTHQSDEFDSLDTSVFDSTPSRHHHEFGVSLSDPTAAFGSVSHNTTPTGIPLSLEHSQSASTSMAGSEMATQWPTNLGNNNPY